MKKANIRRRKIVPKYDLGNYKISENDADTDVDDSNLGTGDNPDMGGGSNAGSNWKSAQTGLGYANMASGLIPNGEGKDLYNTNSSGGMWKGARSVASNIPVVDKFVKLGAAISGGFNELEAQGQKEGNKETRRTGAILGGVFSPSDNHQKIDDAQKAGVINKGTAVGYHLLNFLLPNIGSGIVGGQLSEKADKKQKELEAEERSQNARIVAKNYYDRDKANLVAMNNVSGTGRVNYYAALGGKISPFAKRRYAYGGEMQEDPTEHETVGGDLIPLSDEASVAVGDSHGQDTNGDGQGGITMVDHQGQEYAEVEGGEIITEDGQVIPKRITLPDGQPVSEVYGQLELKKASLKKKLEKETNEYRANHVKRDIEDIKGKQNELVQYAESVKEQVQSEETFAYGGMLPKFDTGTKNVFANKIQLGQSRMTINSDEEENGDDNIFPKRRVGKASDDYTALYNAEETPAETTPTTTGGFARKINFGKIANRVGGVLEGASPYIEDILAMHNLKKLKNIPAPILQGQAPLKTTVNVNPRLNEIESEQSSLNKAFDYNTANSGVARIQRIATSAKAIGEKNKVLANKENLETELTNKAMLQAQTTFAANATDLNTHAKDVWNLEKFKNYTEPSKIYANITAKGMQQQWDKKRNDLDYSTIATKMLQDDTGSYISLMGTEAFDKAVRMNPTLKASLKTHVARSKDKAAQQRFEQLY